ncbi:phytoene desaturase family protein [Heyndrickxia sp. NPDC080065]|uniref:phytoene desaturase family protein n=1 Tax=Heyndrickxia sp. NPDC080065 TaxID=3390568 RepID=UPI003D04765E
MNKYDVVIIGGGLSGLTAANFLASEGKKVVVLEKSNRLGGRAMTNNKNGVLMNLGAHALYLEGEASKILTELGITLPGGNASESINIQGIWKNKVYTIPTSFSSILSSSLLTWKAKVVFSKLMVKLMKMNIDPIPKISLSDWGEAEIHDPMVRHIFYALCRLATYNCAQTLQLAKPVLKQVKRALNGGVLYVDGGWETIIQKLKKEAIDAGADIICGRNLIEIEHHDQSISILCSNGELLTSADCIIATPPKEAMKMIKGSENTSLYQWNEQSIPVTASCLDLAVKKLPNPANQFVIGLDQSLFFTNQSRASKLCEDGTLVVSLTKYHYPINHTINPQIEKDQLETAMDLLHPEWRTEVTVQQFLPKITVSHDFPHIKRRENPGPSIPEMKGLYIAGDWVSHGEVLADAALASGKRAALQILKKNELILVKEG